ncbi:bifunctional tRNA (5-methylaminomethyl-2-thiouridine)(34)-methyltransferase MnmD/FAD-dependent 5-carboxymethylaminomethyl-2-thiouridine(34) oxidoreductase MnmC [Spongiibacter sp.]|uniref:bifunctional tRNA (5-methylaminomethyl-2-thiouridine)(34)-methyltransferase MnmD/FAD-dependent 5-carboxymethylaminomethyl-2-thiouridine(34) oxidoreductase MnmC n=1 Tax=Spongiibacter sp. TaxID=2024860 RepID=UPI003565065A
MDDRDNPYSIECARLQWQEGIPSASDYGDVYFSRDDGLAESRYVFLDHNQLEARWRKLPPDTSGRFTVCETGFGTGLNFLLTWQLWRDCAPAGWTLHYISCEKHPLQAADLNRALNAWPSLEPLSSILQDNYPPLIPGQHRRLLHNSQVCLDLLWGDIADTLPQLLDSVSPDSGTQAGSGPVDAWFLDGFAPASNPGMWQPALFDAMARLSHQGSSFATFTAAGIVKRGLRNRGFVVNKVKGFGRKRDMLAGYFAAAPAAAPDDGLTPSHLPWHQPAARHRPATAIVIGGGLAGCSTARALAERGVQVTVIERSAAIASAASGNPQGVLYTKLSPEPGALNLFTLSSFLYAQHHYRRIAAAGPLEGEFCGVLQLANSPREKQLLERLQSQLGNHDWLEFVSPQQASALSGIPIDRPGIFYPDAGWLSPPAVCRERCNHPGITVVNHCEAIELSDDGEQWQVINAGGEVIAQAEAVVIANSHDAGQFSQSHYLPLRKIRGQLSYFDSAAITHPPRCVVCHEGYFAPALRDQFCIGASFNLKQADTEVRDDDHQFNIDTLAKLNPQLLISGSWPSGGRAGLRCASPDYLPIVGALPDIGAFDQDYAALRKDARQSINRTGRYQRNLYVNVAHGSRGLTSTPLAAELLAAYLCGESRPLPRTLCESVSPARFLIRDLMRNRR